MDLRAGRRARVADRHKYVARSPGLEHPEIEIIKPEMVLRYGAAFQEDVEPGGSDEIIGEYANRRVQDRNVQQLGERIRQRRARRAGHAAEQDCRYFPCNGIKLVLACDHADRDMIGEQMLVLGAGHRVRQPDVLGHGFGTARIGFQQSEMKVQRLGAIILVAIQSYLDAEPVEKVADRLAAAFLIAKRLRFGGKFLAGFHRVQFGRFPHHHTQHGLRNLALERHSILLSRDDVLRPRPIALYRRQMRTVHSISASRPARSALF